MSGFGPEQALALALSLPGAWPDNPWDHQYPVVKVGPDDRGKIFAFIGAEGVGVKCGTREEADEWLARYPEGASVMRYIGRQGWNDLSYATIPAEDLEAAIEESYDRIVTKLPKKLRPHE